MDERQRIAISEMVSDRTPRPLMGPLLAFDMENEKASLREENAWSANGHNARTLIKHSEFRLVLIALKPGQHAGERETASRVVVQLLDGRAHLHVPTENIELRPGQLVSLDRHIQFGIEALEECDVLLWVGWSKE